MHQKMQPSNIVRGHHLTLNVGGTAEGARLLHGARPTCFPLNHPCFKSSFDLHDILDWVNATNTLKNLQCICGVNPVKNVMPKTT